MAESPPPRALTYFEPVRPFQSLTEYEIVLWFGRQDADYQRQVEYNAGLWAGIQEPPRDTIVAYLQKMSAPACPCGFDGSPRAVHQWGPKCMPRQRGKVATPYLDTADEQSDDDLPF